MVTTKTLLLKCLINTMERHDVATTDIPRFLYNPTWMVDGTSENRRKDVKASGKIGS